MDGLLDMMTAGLSGGGELFAATQYAGTGSLQDIVTGQKLSDGGLFWAKQTSDPEIHSLLDTTRGRRAVLQTNSTAPEFVDNSSDQITALPNGVRIEDAESNINADNRSYILFSWLKAAGFLDILTYTGSGAASQALPHTLGKKPAMGIGKSRVNEGNWIVCHQDFDGIGKLNSSNEFQAGSDLSLTSASQVTVSGELNLSGETYVLYLFAEMPGQSQVGSYVGNDGNIGGGDNAVSLSFRPSAILVKSADLGSDWVLSYANDGGSGNLLIPNKTNGQQVTSAILHMPSGFTLKNNDGKLNNLATTYLYAAFA